MESKRVVLIRTFNPVSQIITFIAIAIHLLHLYFQAVRYKCTWRILEQQLD